MWLVIRDVGARQGLETRTPARRVAGSTLVGEAGVERVQQEEAGFRFIQSGLPGGGSSAVLSFECPCRACQHAHWPGRRRLAQRLFELDGHGGRRVAESEERQAAECRADARFTGAHGLFAEQVREVLSARQHEGRSSAGEGAGGRRPSRTTARGVWRQDELLRASSTA